MNASRSDHLGVLDLPNEILLIIFSKLNMVDVLRSLVVVNQRLDQLVLDPVYIRCLDRSMTSRTTRKPYFVRSFAANSDVLDRICQNIFPQICDKVSQLTLEKHSMERVLRTINYLLLTTLSLLDFPEKTLQKSLKGKRLDFVCSAKESTQKGSYESHSMH